MTHHALSAFKWRIFPMVHLALFYKQCMKGVRRLFFEKGACSTFQTTEIDIFLQLIAERSAIVFHRDKEWKWQEWTLCPQCATVEVFIIFICQCFANLCFQVIVNLLLRIPSPMYTHTYTEKRARSFNCKMDWTRKPDLMLTVMIISVIAGNEYQVSMLE